MGERKKNEVEKGGKDEECTERMRKEIGKGRKCAERENSLVEREKEEEKVE